MSKKIVISAIGGPEVLKYIDYDLPSNLQKDHVRIRQTSIGVNFIDTYHRSGIYPLPSKTPVCPGLEAAGEIIDLGTEVEFLLNILVHLDYLKRSMTQYLSLHL